MPGRTLPTFTLAEVESHNTEKSCYVTLGRNVYDVTDFLDSHPGGADLVLDYAGKDVGDILKDEASHTHSDTAYEVLDDSLVGFLASANGKTVTANGNGQATASGVDANGNPIHPRTGMSCAEDLSRDTDLSDDYKKHKFLDLNKPLFKQVWFGGFSKDFYLDQVHRPRHYKGGASAPLFGNFLEPLTKTAWWVVPLVWLPPISYGLYLGNEGFGSVLSQAPYFVLGLGFWSFFEYILHRFLFHLDYYLPDNRVGITLHFTLHGIHHYLPMDKYRLVMPPALFVILATPFWKLAHLLFWKNWYVATTVYCGGIFGYVCYDLTHYFIHHKNLPLWYQSLKKHHLEHHFLDYENGFGVTSLFWDRVFGTEIVPVVKTKGGRSRSRSPRRNSYRPRGGDRDRGDRDRDRDRDRASYRRRDEDRASRRNSGDRDRDRTPPKPTEDERDRKTVFVQQLAARLRTKELKAFFEKAGPVFEAQIVKDRVSNRSKGVGYVEFESEESVPKALQLTGTQLLGIPVIVQMTEAEKNRQVRAEASSSHPNQVPFHRLYVGNIHFSITEEDLRNVFSPFGELEFVQLQKDENGRSRGYGFVQFHNAAQAKEALEKMNGFDLAGRPIRVGLGNDKFTPESTANLMQRFPNGGGPSNFQGSTFSGAGGRGNQNSNFDRAGGRDNEKGAGASALDDTDVAGVNFNNYSRDALMRKLARTDEPAATNERATMKPKMDQAPSTLPVSVPLQATRCVLLKNMFDPEEETGEDWVKELEDDVRTEAESKYGHVIHIAVDPNSSGEIYLKFDKISGGENAIKGLNGRYFGGRMITAQPVVDAVYSSLFSRARAT
ncbi:hypothetical protein V8F06_007471 [Rhypophila decipiens]